ncbi:phage holin family protein [Niameybacter massiliensis]|uniref:Phage holin family protein n=1 Tax=Holtiella tumoricola TaxID=3018743 RepID=A0AA42IYK8_9FIRM|nr:MULTISPECIES: phage holin family protein [Lachnospirales]MDA3730084.1 phage holin family protein [Holtiella tumoricola]
MNIERVFEILIAFIAAVFTFLFGVADKLILFLLLLSAVDFYMGLRKAYRGKSDKTKNGRLSSRAAAEGLEKKGNMFMVLIVANVCDQMFNTGGMIRTATLWFYITTEGISIIENAALLGLKIPKVLVDILEVKNRLADEGKVNENE